MFYCTIDHYETDLSKRKSCYLFSQRTEKHYWRLEFFYDGANFREYFIDKFYVSAKQVCLSPDVADLCFDERDTEDNRQDRIEPPALFADH